MKRLLRSYFNAWMVLKPNGGHKQCQGPWHKTLFEQAKDSTAFGLVFADFLKETIRLFAPSSSFVRQAIPARKRFETVTHQRIIRGELLSFSGSVNSRAVGISRDNGDVKSGLELGLSAKSATSNSRSVRLGEQEDDGSKLHGFWWAVMQLLLRRMRDVVVV